MRSRRLDAFAMVALIVALACGLAAGVVAAPAGDDEPATTTEVATPDPAPPKTKAQPVPLPVEVQRAGGNPDRDRGELPATLGMRHGPVLPGSAVYPDQSLPLRFDHGRHLGMGLDCAVCHDKVAGSRRAEDYNFPRGATCDGCHGKQHPLPAGGDAHCSDCHTRAEDKRVTAFIDAPTPMLRFDHSAHLGRGATCQDCHGDMSKVRLATTLQLPKERDCLGCHDGFKAGSACATCHPTNAAGRLVTRARDDRVSPALIPRGRNGSGMAHDLAFVSDHAGVAKSNPEACQTCHEQAFCQDCHAGSVRPLRIHSGDYLTIHAMDARARTQDCQSCHREQTFCMGCHQRVGFGDRSQGGFGVGGGRQFHPADWAGPPGMPQGHAFAAQRAMGSCVSCHDEDSCLACHATTSAASPGLDVSPHGPGFASSTRCKALESRNRRVCLKCHAPGDPNLDCR